MKIYKIVLLNKTNQTTTDESFWLKYENAQARLTHCNHVNEQDADAENWYYYIQVFETSDSP